MKNNLTEIVFILDRSGSMAGLESDTVGGFNAMLKKQRECEGDAYVSTVLFNDRSSVLHDRVPIEQVRPITVDDYTVSGCTALYDAIGFAVKHIGNVHKYARPEDVPEHTVFFITTDGMENTSRRFTLSDVQRLIRRQTEHFGWEFVFLAANIDEKETADALGIGRESSVRFDSTPDGVQACFSQINAKMMHIRSRNPKV